MLFTSGVTEFEMLASPSLNPCTYMYLNLFNERKVIHKTTLFFFNLKKGIMSIVNKFT